MKASSYSQNTESKGSLRGITLNIELSQKKKKKKTTITYIESEPKEKRSTIKKITIDNEIPNQIEED